MSEISLDDDVYRAIVLYAARCGMSPEAYLLGILQAHFAWVAHGGFVQFPEPSVLEHLRWIAETQEGLARDQREARSTPRGAWERRHRDIERAILAAMSPTPISIAELLPAVRQTFPDLDKSTLGMYVGGLVAKRQIIRTRVGWYARPA